MIATAAIPKDVRRRVARGLSATALAPLVTAAIQLGTVPLLLHAWGPGKYGDWLILSAIPNYLTLSDLGFGDASGSDMTARVATGDRSGALRTFQSSWLLLNVVALFALTLVCAFAWLAPWQHWLGLSSLTRRESAATLSILGAYVVVTQQCGILESGFRCDGNFALGTFWHTVLRLGDAVLGCVVGVMTGQFFLVALTYLAARIVGTTWYGLLLRKKSPWLLLGIRHARAGTIKELAKPAAGFMALPVGYALSFQGFTILIGAVLGAVAVATFSTLRTLTRVNSQLLVMLAHALWPELSWAFGAGDISLARKLHRSIYKASLGLSLVSCSLLWMIGPLIYHLWIHDALRFNYTCFHVLIVVSIANALWYTSAVVSMSANAHYRLAISYLLGTAVSLAVGWTLISRWGITGAALSLLPIDLLMSFIVLRASLHQVRDTPTGFFASLFTIPPTLRASRT